MLRCVYEDKGAMTVALEDITDDGYKDYQNKLEKDDKYPLHGRIVLLRDKWDTSKDIKCHKLD